MSSYKYSKFNLKIFLYEPKNNQKSFNIYDKYNNM